MQMTQETVARAFSGHRFEDALPRLDDDVLWELVGGEEVRGKPAVVRICESLAEDLTDVQTDFEQFRVITAGESVIVDSVARYAGADGSLTRVASCDIYDFVDARVAKIRSYNVELTPGSPA
ncbi:nuclear transport factor 2 family protein [Arthrobacter frigidicola]|nr:nuclear transport factor 2 family protein [Arthrobacter frigidicola]